MILLGVEEVRLSYVHQLTVIVSKARVAVGGLGARMELALVVRLLDFVAITI